MRRLLLAAALLATTQAGAGCALAQPAGGAAAPVRADTAALRRTLDSIADAHRGVLGYAVRNLETGERLDRRADEPFPSASIVKVPVLVTLHDLVRQGRISLDDRLTVLKIDQVGGSGTLQHMRPGMEITVGDAAWLMTTISDNTATNLLLDRVGIRRTWARMEALGLPRTKIHSKSFDRSTSVAMDSSAKYGLGVTTPGEMARLFELLARGQAVSPPADSAMLEVLRHNEEAQMLTRFTPGARVAHKSGAVNQARNECGLFWLPDRVVVCAMTRENQDESWRVDNEAHVAIARVGEAVVRAWRRPAPAAAER